MKRNLDLIRAILFEMEKDDQIYFFDPELVDTELQINGFSAEQISYHMKLMVQAGLLHADEEIIEMPSQVKSLPSMKSKSITYSISWHGHEFLDAIRDETRWKNAKDAIVKVGGLATEVAFDILKEMGKRAAIKLLLP
jgi:hypothetical protein